MAGILGSVYRALDPILPFDRYLDSRFGILGDDPRQMPAGGVLGGMGGVQPPTLTPAAYAPPQAPQSAPELAGGPPPAQSINPRMGFPTMGAPRMGAASQAAPQAAPRRTNGWRVLDRVLGGSTITDALDTERARPQLMEEAARKRAREEEEDALARRVFADDERGYLAWRANREKAGEALSSGLEDYTLAPGGVRGRAGETLQRAPFAPINASPGTQVIDPTTGKVIAQAPFKPEVVTAPTTSSVTVVDPNAPGGGPSVGERNNNPGNLEDGEFARSQPGYVGTDGRFARFATPEAGAAAQERLLANSYIARGQNTIQSIIEGVPGEGGRRVHGYSPRQSDGGDNTDEQVNNYIGYVARRAGVDPSAPIPADRVSAVAAAMREFETGQRPGATGGGTRVVQQGVAKPAGHMATPEELQALKLDPDQPVWIGEDGRPSPIREGGVTPRDRVQLRKEFEQLPDVKAFNDVAASYDIITRLGTDSPSAANDMSIIFAYMKMLDPGSVVREGEFATAQNSAGLPDQVRNAYNRTLNGQRLAPKQRQEFIATAKTIYSSRRTRYDQQLAQYQGYARELGLPDTTIQGRVAAGAPASPTAGAPRRGPPAGTKPIVVRSEREANALPDGTWVSLNGRIGQVKK